MTDVQKILLAMATGYHDGQIGEEDCEGIAKALNGVPECFHMDALKSFLGVQEEQPEEQPEDYLSVKTYTSNEVGVGDEIKTDSGIRFVVVSMDDNVFHLASPGAVLSIKRYSSGYIRTGRNFPAIAAIMEELKRLDRPRAE